MPKNSKAKIKANNEYTKRTYDRINFFVPKGRRHELKSIAEDLCESLNEFVNRAIDERIERLQAEAPFTPPPGELCLEDCQKRGEAISGGKKYPWCFAYGVEISDHDEQTGQYRKCTGCLHDKNKPPE